MNDDQPAGADRIVTVGGKRLNLVRIAGAQRLLINMFGLLTLVNFAILFSGTVVRGAGSSVQAVFTIFVLLLNLVAVVGVIIASARLAKATGSNLFLAIIGGLLTLVPILGLLLLLAANARATRVLKRHGVPVGFLGVSKAQVARLREGACKSCGYDIRGLKAGVCPECGAALSNPVELPVTA